MPKYFNYKIAGFFLYFTSYCVVEAMHAHASDRKLTEPGSAKFFIKKTAIPLLQTKVFYPTVT